MSKRSIPILLLAFAFLLSAWGNVIAAAFCPRYLSNRVCSAKSAPEPKHVEQSSCHHEMADMEIDDMQMDETKDAAEAETSVSVVPGDRLLEIGIAPSAQDVSIELPDEPCGHCWMHSQPASGTATLVAVDRSKQLIDTNVPPGEVAINVFRCVTVTASITPVQHGPPGNLLPRHLLISIFRI